MNAAANTLTAPAVENESAITAEEGQLEQQDPSNADALAENTANTASPSDDTPDSPIVDNYIVALVDLEIDANGNYWEKGHDGHNAPAVGFVKAGKVYEVNYSHVGDDNYIEGESRVEVIVSEEIGDEWEWDGLQELDPEQWRYARESDLETEAKGETEAAAEPLPEPVASPASTEPVPLTPEQAIRDYQAYVRNVDTINKRLRAAQQAVYSQELTVKSERDELKRRQEQVDAITRELSDACAAAPDPKRYPLLDRNGASDLPGMDVGTSESKAVESEPQAKQSSLDEPQADDTTPDPAADAAEDDSWKSVLIEHALPGLSQGLYDKLHTVDIETMGDLAAYTAEVPLTMIKGIGEAAATKIDEACEAFWQKRQSETGV